ncbi:NUDIX domain-containing protein [Candidatus Uhrbacteria bacterium]|nr:NUDIX domain-containing protein [Candidatus Uhrbacteria bacterium]
MPYERSVGAIVFRRGEPPEQELHFLLLRYPGGYWEFPRGHVEVGEREHTTAIREIQEETGITDLKFLRGFRERYRFHFRREGQSVTKDAIIYLAESPTWSVVTSEEHFGYVWVSYDDALTHLKFDNSKAIMRAAHAFFARRRRGGGRPRTSDAARKSAA